MKYLLFCCTFFFVFAHVGSGQITPRVRPLSPQKPPTSNTRIVKADSTPHIKGFSNVNNAALMATWSNQHAMLRFANQINEPDCHGPHCAFWEYRSHDVQSVSKSPLSRNWVKKIAWKKFPAGTVYGRWEIATQPFPPNIDPHFTGLIRSGLVATKGIDSVYFDLTYTDDANMPTRASTPISRPLGQRQPKTTGSSFSGVDKSLMAKFVPMVNEERQFYIRMVPLDANQNPLAKISNEITIKENYFEWKAPPPQEYLANDYTITAVKFVPVHYPEPNYACCSIVAGYNGNPTDPLVKSFQAAFPIGSTLCPEPPKDKAWYEKAFDDVTGFVEKSINGAANFYNETKEYLKKKFKEFSCNANGSINVVNPVSKAQELAGPEVCEYISGAAFDYGMMAVGLPPTLPNVDDLSKMAEGQIVDVACDKIEMETGLPLPEEAREKIRKEFHDNVVAQSNNGLINTGFMRARPHPQGQFQTAYLQIEITRTGNNYKKQGLVGFAISDITTRTIEDWNAAEKKKVPVGLKGNLFASTSCTVPYLDQVGDKTTVYVVLKPQESYAHNNKTTGMISQVQNYPPLNQFYTPPAPTYEGYTHTSGFQLLSTGSVTNFSLGLKVAPGVNLTIVNK